MSFSTGFRKCKKCGKTLFGLFDGELCDECEKAEQEPCDDVVSRQAVLDCATLITSIPTEDWDIGDWVCLFRDRVSQLPSVRPQPKMGHWEKADDKYGAFFICDNCHRQSDIMENYCPNCGAKIESEVSNEDSN